MKILNSIDEVQLTSLCQAKEFFWLDLVNPSAAEVKHLGDVIGLHPLAVEDTVHFDQRPKLDEYGDCALLVLYGGVEHDPEDENDHPVEEIHCYISGDFLVTVTKNPFDELERVKQSLQTRDGRTEQYYVYKVMDTIVDSFFPVLASLDDEINDLEDAIVAGGTTKDLQRIFRLKRLLLKMRRVVVPMRDVFAREIDTIADMAGLEKDSHDYFRDVYDHLIRITDLLDGYHEMVNGCTDLYLSTVANRQGEISKQLTIVASIFLPLSFLTGFFGMNFTWQGTHMLTGAWQFWVWGVGTMAVAALFMRGWFKHKGWIGRTE